MPEMFFSVPPAFVMLFGALILPLVPKNLRSAGFIVFPAATLVLLWSLPDGLTIRTDFMRYTLILCKVDSLSRIFGAIFAIVAVAGGLYAYHIKETGQQVAALFYGGSAIGIAFAGDYLTLLVYWELMAVSSVYLVWARRTREAETAGMRYLFVHIFGGSLLLAGILLHTAESGSTIIARLPSGASVSSWLILTGVAINAAIPPLHAWLVDAYPKATVTGAVFMSAFTTKSAVYVLARVFPGWEILIVFGVIMALYGVVYAVLANDIREILAYHIISQVGYMVAGVGIGTEMALNGTTAHAFSHILYKALLFMGAGVVLQTTGKSKLTELGGLAAAMPLTLALYMVGAFSISGFPLFNGFISKSMVVSAAGEAHYANAMLLLNLAAVGTFLHTGLKLPYFTWFAENRGLKPEKPPITMLIGMGIVAFLCTMFGVAPKLLYDHLPYPVSYVPYTIPHLVETTYLLIFTFIGFWVLRSKLAGEPTIALDADWFYRRPARLFKKYLVASVANVFDRSDQLSLSFVAQLSKFVSNPTGHIQHLLLSSKQKEKLNKYDPEQSRPLMQFLIGVVLMSFVFVLLFTLIR